MGVCVELHKATPLRIGTGVAREFDPMPPTFSARERGFTLIELLIVCAILGILASIAGTRMLRARMSANEASAAAGVRVINSGQASYSSSCASGGYAIDLADLAKAPPGAVEAFVSPDLSANGIRKSGYAFTLAKSGEPGTVDIGTATCNSAAGTPATGYQVNADAVGALAGRFFASDKRATIFQDDAIIANPIPPGATIFR